MGRVAMCLPHQTLNTSSSHISHFQASDNLEERKKGASWRKEMRGDPGELNQICFIKLIVDWFPANRL